MNLFPSNDLNLLPYDGDATLQSAILDPKTCVKWYNYLLNNICWKADELVMFGKKIVTKRKTAWYGDKQYTYRYSNVTKTANLWSTELKELKSTIETVSGFSFNSCLLNLYHNGNEGMAWHSDNEPELGPRPTIASLSLGSERKFSFKHKETKETISTKLQNGSLLVMKGKCQEKWLHSLPKTKKVSNPRINLTFRSIID